MATVGAVEVVVVLVVFFSAKMVSKIFLNAAEISS